MLRKSKLSLLYLFACICLCSCTILFVGFKPHGFKYYDKKFMLDSSNLKVDGFYYCKLYDTYAHEYYYSYLRFYKDGRINSKNMDSKPEVIKESYWPFNDVYGYYTVKADSVFYELKSRYHTYRHGNGIVDVNALHVKVFDKRSNGDTTYYSNYIFHQGFAE